MIRSQFLLCTSASHKEPIAKISKLYISSFLALILLKYITLPCIFSLNHPNHGGFSFPQLCPTSGW